MKTASSTKRKAFDAGFCVRAPTFAPATLPPARSTQKLSELQFFHHDDSPFFCLAGFADRRRGYRPFGHFSVQRPAASGTARQTVSAPAFFRRRRFATRKIGSNLGLDAPRFFGSIAFGQEQRSHRPRRYFWKMDGVAPCATRRNRSHARNSR